MSRQIKEICQNSQTDRPGLPRSCQLGSIGTIKVKNSWLNDLLQYRVNIFRPTKRRLICLRNRIMTSIGAKPTATHKPSPCNDALSAGDTVNVLKKEEIRRLLDVHEKYRGCLFIDEMYQYCGREFTVLKEVVYFFDEAKNKMCKCKDIFMLKGVTCSGRQRLYPVSCDRGCYFFWHRDWLQKI